MNSQTIIFGAKGFIGSYLSQDLKKRGHSVFGLGRDQGDLRNSDSVDKISALLPNEIDVILCTSVNRLPGEPESIFIENRFIAEHVSKILNKKNVRSFVFLSSTDVYGRPPSETPLSESSPCLSKTFYGKSKLDSENFFKSTIDAPVGICRLPGIYGPGDGSKSIIGAFCKKVLEGKEIELNGGGVQKRDFFHVQNIADLIDLNLKAPSSFKLNLATGKSKTILEIVDMISNSLSKKTSLKVLPTNTDVFDYEFEIQNLKEKFPSLDLIDMKQGISSYGNTLRTKTENKT